jgi:WD40 repeat protein
MLFGISAFGQINLNDNLRLVLPICNLNDRNAVFSSDNRFVLSFGGEACRLWDVATGKELHIYDGHEEKNHVACFGTNNKFVLSASCSSICIWDLFSGKINNKYYIQNTDCENQNAVKFNHDGSLLAFIGIDNNVSIVNSLTGDTIKILKGHNEKINNIFFSKDAKYLLSNSNDRTTRIWDINTGNFKQLKTDLNYIENAEFSPDTKKVVTCYNEHTAVVWDLESGEIINQLYGHYDIVKNAKFSSNGNLIITTSFDKTAIVYDLTQQSKNDLRLEPKIVLRGHNDIVNDAIFNKDDKLVLTSSKDGKIILWDVNIGDSISVYDAKCGSIEYSIFSPNEKIFLTKGSEDGFQLYDVETNRELRKFRGTTDLLSTAKFNPNYNKILTVGTNNARVWDLYSGRELMNFKGHRDPISYEFFSPEGDKLITADSDTMVILWDVKTGKKIKELQYHKNGVILANFSQDRSRLATVDGNYNILIWDSYDYRLIKYLEVRHKSKINSVEFSKDSKKIITSSDDGTAIIWDLHDGRKEIVLVHSDKIENAYFYDSNTAITKGLSSKDKKWQISSGEEIEISPFDYGTGLNGFFETEITSNDNDFFEFYDYDGNFKRLNNLHTCKILNAEISSDNKILLTRGADNKTIIWDVYSGKPIYIRADLQNDNWIIKLPYSKYFWGSREAAKMLHYVTPDLKVIGFEQLDPVFNRPDIVLDSIGRYFGNINQTQICKYRAAWVKRIERLGLIDVIDKLGNVDIAVPYAKIVNEKEIKYNQYENRINISIKAHDPKYLLLRFNLIVNEVPIYGSHGISLTEFNKKEWDTTISVVLDKGENKIQVSVMNELGFENFKYPLYVNFQSKESKAKTHYIGIGVNEFKATDKNLLYCINDVKDLANELGRNTIVKLLINETVNRENVLLLKNYLMDSTSAEDRVIISCSSHGLLDKSQNFYLAMHDMDFKKPEVRGLKYDELENLLDGIPARKKLLLLDACNSGENDTSNYKVEDCEEIALITTSKQIDKEEMGRKKPIVRGEKSVIYSEADENRFNRMKELFVNVRNNTGSFIISAAGGHQGAQDGVIINGKKIENGAFTYSVLEFLRNNKNSKEKITVNNLKKYVEKRVVEITNKNQTPTSRQETMEIDWELK